MFSLKLKRKAVVSALIVLAVAGGSVWAKPKKSDLVKQEPGYYYGFGEGVTAEEAQYKGKMDLVVNAISSEIRLKDPTADNVEVSEDVVKARVGDMKVFAESKDGLKVAYRIRTGDWEKAEKKYAENLRKSLNGAYQILSGNAKSADRLTNAVKILSVLAENGETDNLLLQEGGSELYSVVVEKLAQNIINDLKISTVTANGFINSSKPVVVNVKDGTGKPVAGLKLKAVWASPYLSITVNAEDLAEVISFATTDASGNATINYPVADEYQNRLTCLTISTAFATGEFITGGMRKIDNASAVEARYYYTNDVEEFLRTIKVEGGEYKTGAVAHDSKAMGYKEGERKAKVASYALGKTPVTNMQFAAYLYLTGSEEYPEYFDHSDYNQENQPVIAVTAVQAENFVKWLSEQTGSTYRLPTDDEWEIAARAGRNSIFPWGDDSPSKVKNANCKGNGKFKAPSPVGSFVEGNSAWGFEDMSGNVWEWTSSVRNDEKNEEVRTVKGGSWMDGPNDLRISHYKNINKESTLPDVGFRVLMEVR